MNASIVDYNYQKKADSLFERYTSGINILAEMAFKAHVKPLCDQYRLKFISAMGTWFFVSVKTEKILHPEDWPSMGIFKRVYEVLGTELDGQRCADLGDFVESYNPEAE